MLESVNCVEKKNLKTLAHRACIPFISYRQDDHAPTLFIRDLDDPVTPVFARDITEVTRGEVRLSPCCSIIWQIPSARVGTDELSIHETKVAVRHCPACWSTPE